MIKIMEKVTFHKLNELIPYENNSRMHSDNQLDQLVNSLREYGFTNPILIDKSYNVIAGHGRLEAAKRLNMQEVPCIVLNHLTEQQKQAYRIADNKLAENSSWDDDLLKSELILLRDGGYDLSILGFTEDEIKLSTIGWETDFTPEMVGDLSISSKDETTFIITCKPEQKDKLIELINSTIKDNPAYSNVSVK